MNRKAFIKRAGFVGIGIGLTPWKLLSAESALRTFALPNATVHIPHGNFATTDLEKLRLPDMNLECTVQQFMRNGIEASADDLTVYSFRLGEEWLNVSFTRSGKTSSNGQLSGLRLSFDDEKSPPNSLVVVHEGDVKVDGKRIVEGDCVYTAKTSTIEPSENSRVFVLENQ